MAPCPRLLPRPAPRPRRPRLAPRLRRRRSVQPEVERQALPQLLHRDRQHHGRLRRLPGDREGGDPGRPRSISIVHTAGVTVAGAWVAPAPANAGTGLVPGWPPPSILTQSPTVQWSKRVTAAGAALDAGGPTTSSCTSSSTRPRSRPRPPASCSPITTRRAPGPSPGSTTSPSNPAAASPGRRPRGVVGGALAGALLAVDERPRDPLTRPFGQRSTASVYSEMRHEFLPAEAGLPSGRDCIAKDGRPRDSDPAAICR